MTKRHVSTEIVSAVFFGIFVAIADPGGAARAQSPARFSHGVYRYCRLVLVQLKNSPTSATRPRVSSSKAERSTLKAICGSWRSAVGGFHI